jgi:hypothetical protein
MALSLTACVVEHPKDDNHNMRSGKSSSHYYDNRSYDDNRRCDGYYDKNNNYHTYENSYDNYCDDNYDSDNYDSRSKRWKDTNRRR